MHPLINLTGYLAAGAFSVLVLIHTVNTFLWRSNMAELRMNRNLLRMAIGTFAPRSDAAALLRECLSVYDELVELQNEYSFFQLCCRGWLNRCRANEQRAMKLLQCLYAQTGINPLQPQDAYDREED